MAILISILPVLAMLACLTLIPLGLPGLFFGIPVPVIGPMITAFLTEGLDRYRAAGADVVRRQDPREPAVREC